MDKTLIFARLNLSQIVVQRTVLVPVKPFVQLRQSTLKEWYVTAATAVDAVYRCVPNN
jgi:hypothetical protein